MRVRSDVTDRRRVDAPRHWVSSGELAAESASTKGVEHAARWSGAVAGFVPVPMDASVGTLGQDERPTDPTRELSVGHRVEDLRHRLLRVRRLRRVHALCPSGSI